MLTETHLNKQPADKYIHNLGQCSFVALNGKPCVPENVVGRMSKSCKASFSIFLAELLILLTQILVWDIINSACRSDAKELVVRFHYSITLEMSAKLGDGSTSEIASPEFEEAI